MQKINLQETKNLFFNLKFDNSKKSFFKLIKLTEKTFVYSHSLFDNKMRLIELYKLLDLLMYTELILLIKLWFRYLTLYYLILFYDKILGLLIHILREYFNINFTDKFFDKFNYYFENPFIILQVLYITFYKCSWKFLEQFEIDAIKGAIKTIFTNSRLQVYLIIPSLFWVAYNKQIKSFFEKINYKGKVKPDSKYSRLFKEIYSSLMYNFMNIIVFYLILIIFTSNVYTIYDFIEQIPDSVLDFHYNN